jgi:hypothetical protein
MVAAGCGSSATRTASSTPSYVATEATAPTTTTTASSAPTGPPAFVERGRTSEGYEATIEGRLGTALKPGESDVDQSVLSGCPGVNGHELVVRLDLRVTLLSSIATDVELGAFGQAVISKQQFATVLGLTEGPSCLTEGTGGGEVNLYTMQPHTSKTFTAWVVLLNAINPDHPQPSNMLLGEEWWFGFPLLFLNGQVIPEPTVSGPRVISCEGELFLVPAGTPPASAYEKTCSAVSTPTTL